MADQPGQHCAQCNLPSVSEGLGHRAVPAAFHSSRGQESGSEAHKPELTRLSDLECGFAKQCLERPQIPTRDFGVGDTPNSLNTQAKQGVNLCCSGF